MRHPNIRMIRAHLEDLPPVAVPNGYAIRTAWPGFEGAWVAVINTAFEGTDEFTIEQCRDRFFGQRQFDPAGMFFACASSEAVGTAFAWLEQPEERVWGRVHWVAVVPQHRGQGLGRTLTVAVLHHLRRRGFAKAFLTTQEFRIPAIRIYTSLGFQPDPRNDQEEAIWLRVMQNLGAPQRPQ